MYSLAKHESAGCTHQMKAALQRGIREFEVAAIDRPQAGYGMVVARITAAGICGSDLRRYIHRAEPQRIPDGHELSGVVVEVGQGVDNVSVGDRVAIDAVVLGRGCGTCSWCRSGNHAHCRGDRFPLVGGFAEYVLRRAAGFFKIPDNVDDRLAALVEPLAVGFHAVRWMKVEPEARVAIVGAGTIGLATLLAARWLGIEHIYVSAKYQFQAEVARSFGAAAVLPVDAHSVEVAMRDLTGGRGADYVFETVGERGDAVDLACRIARPQGKVAILGAFALGPATVDLWQPYLNELTISMPQCYSVIDGRHDFPLALELVERQPSLVDRLITHEFSLDEIAIAFATAADKNNGSIKVLVRP